MKDGAEEVGVEGHGFGKGVVAVAGDEQVVFLAAELRIATWDHPGGANTSSAVAAQSRRNVTSLPSLALTILAT